MTGLDLFSVQDVIATHISSSLPNYEIKEDYVLDDEQILKIDNKTKPFIVLRWHGLERSTENTSFMGPRYDEYSSAVDIVFVAPNPKIARRGLSMVMDELIGWELPSGSQLTPTGGQSVFAVPDYNGKPHIYMAVNTLEFQVDSNALNNGS